MTPRRARTLAGGSLAISGLLCAGAAVFLVLGRDTPILPNEFGFKGYGSLDVQSAPASGTLVIGRIPVTRETPG